MSEETTIIEKGAVVLDTYRVESDAIQGGMGKVWRVHQRAIGDGLILSHRSNWAQDKENRPHCLSQIGGM